MTNLVVDVANQALDAIFWSNSISDLEEGTYEARVILRAYSQCLRQLLRSAHWGFARKSAPLVLLADASGQTPDVGSFVDAPFRFSYQYPIDCMKMRFIPHRSHRGGGVPTGNITPTPLLPQPPAPTVGSDFSSDFNSDFGPIPFVPGSAQVLYVPPTTAFDSGSRHGGHERPARWLEGVDTLNVPPAGVQDWTQQGVSPQGRTAIFTNVQHAHGVYTALMNYPSNWDPLFRAAFVAYLASEIAPGVWANKDRKFGMAMRAQQVGIAKDKIMSARAASANESWSNSDFEPDWMKFRRAGADGYGRHGGEGPGYYYSGLDDCCGCGNTSAY